MDGRLQDTQVHRALRELGMELICAHSSQAKGHGERANQTLQDRLIKEMRLRNISSIEEENNYVKEFILNYNRDLDFTRLAMMTTHGPLCQEVLELKRALSIQSARKLSKNLEFSFEGLVYQIKT